jgi:RNA polymerase sigma-70 factor (ECF subfamily)
VLLTRIIDAVARTDGPRVLAGLIRLTGGDFDAAEDALQEAYARALVVWRRDGIPAQPGAWINTVSRRALVDALRRETTRRKWSTSFDEDVADAAASAIVVDHADGSGPDDPSGIDDDRLRLLFVCCHPALSPEAQKTLALRTLGGLTTREIARAFVEPEPTTAQRLVRAKRKIREARIAYEVPPRARLPERIDVVLSVLYLIFNEGYASTDAASLVRPDLMAEAIRLTRLAVELLPEATEVRGLLALMLLIDARRPGRLDGDGALVPLEEQDRGLWQHDQIDEGVTLLDRTLAQGAPGPYQIQAAIAALHGRAATAAATDWPQIAALYRALLQVVPTPIVELNAAVALGLATDVERALRWIARLERHPELASYHLVPASQADLLRRQGRFDEAARAYRRALTLVTNPAERRYLDRRLAECDAASTKSPMAEAGDRPQAR